MIKYISCTSWNRTELNNILLNAIKCLIWSYIMFNSIIISVFSVIASITSFDISTLYRYHKLIKCFVIQKHDIWCKLQGSGNTTTCAYIRKKINAMIE